MLEKKIKAQTMSIGQIAKRWGVSRERVRQLVERGLIPDAFCIPSSGRYGETIKVPIASVEQVEDGWRLRPDAMQNRPPRRRGGLSAELRHFPELRLISEHDAESHEDAQH